MVLNRISVISQIGLFKGQQGDVGEGYYSRTFLPKTVAQQDMIFAITWALPGTCCYAVPNLGLVFYRELPSRGF